MSLKSKLAGLIAADGPMTAEAFMRLCLHDPEFGYYATRPALGAPDGENGGDFITAPMISQMFGELIGLWAIETWSAMARPSPFSLVEMGPGDGTLMSDVLRASRVLPAFLDAADLWLVETSAPLRALQRERLGERARWTSALAEVPAGAPMILLANELLDCLPVRQFVRTEQGWAERRVGLGQDELIWGLSPAPAGFQPPDGMTDLPPGTLIELSPAQAALGAEVGARVARDGGAALFIDYGRDRPEAGDTLQAVMRHEKVDVLKGPGEADLTVHTDFPAFANAARGAGAETTAIVTQRDFLLALGVEHRAAALARAQPDEALTVGRQLHRLIDPAEMGTLFKAVCVHQRGIDPPGFPPESRS